MMYFPFDFVNFHHKYSPRLKHQKVMFLNQLFLFTNGHKKNMSADWADMFFIE